MLGATLHGPLFFAGFRWLDRVNVGTTQPFRRAVLKSLLGQVTLFPAYVCAFPVYMGCLEGKRGDAIVAKSVNFIPTTLVTGSFFWPIANVANFMFVPPTMRLVYVNACGLFWNTVLSYLNSAKDPSARS